MEWGLSTCISVELPGDDEAEQMVSYMVSCLLVELEFSFSINLIFLIFEISPQFWMRSDRLLLHS